jgi:hypothetical protein
MANTGRNTAAVMAAVVATLASAPVVRAAAPAPTGPVVVITVFRITDLARQGRCFVGNVLGKVLAHEVGHLLLPRPGHADRGIMQAGLDLTPDEELFTVVEANAMRGVLTRAQAAD